MRHWNILVGGRISSKQTEHSNSLSKLDRSCSSISNPAKFPKLEAPLSMLSMPPDPKGLDDTDDGPHATAAPEIFNFQFIS